MSFKEELKKAFEGQNPPYLFVGSGFSKRYLASPSWGELLEKIRATLGDSYPQEKYIDPKVTPPDLPGYAEKWQMILKIYGGILIGIRISTGIMKTEKLQLETMVH